jgi:hypothetical protein
MIRKAPSGPAAPNIGSLLWGTSLTSAALLDTYLSMWVGRNSNANLIFAPEAGIEISSVWVHFTLNSGAALPAGTTIEWALFMAPEIAGPYEPIFGTSFVDAPPRGGIWLDESPVYVPGGWVISPGIGVFDVPLITSGNGYFSMQFN